MNGKTKNIGLLLIVANMILVCGCPFQLGRRAGSGTTDDSGAARNDAADQGDEGAADDVSIGDGAEGVEGDPAVGAALFSDNGCAVCHGDDGSGNIGPDIRLVGVETLDEELRNPETTHTGGVFADLTDDDLDNLVAFLGGEGLPPAEAPEPPPAPIHSADLGGTGILHGEGFADPSINCAVCHGSDLSGSDFAPSCTTCHGPMWAGVDGPPMTHTDPKGSDGVLHRPGFADPAANCSGCHGADLEGSGSRPSCTSCHDQLWPGAGLPANHVVSLGTPAVMHRRDPRDAESNCTACHGSDLTGSGSVPSCYTCHGAIWAGGDPPPTHTVVLTSGSVTGRHAEGRFDPTANCSSCHQADLMGRYRVPACYSCHGELWAGGGLPPTHTERKVDGAISGMHAPGPRDPSANCARCHQSDLGGTSLIPSCWSCHGSKWAGAPVYPPDHVVTRGSPPAVHRSGLTDPLSNCTSCHGADLAGNAMIPSCYTCHGPLWSGGGPPPTHVHVYTTVDVTGTHAQGAYDPLNNCAPCHQGDLMGRYRVPACYSCHGQLWQGGRVPPSHTEVLSSRDVTGRHASGRENPEENCASCHRSGLTGTSLIPACWSCHGSRWDPEPDYPPDHVVLEGSSPDQVGHLPGLTDPMSNCVACHGAGLMGTALIPSCYSCHGSLWSDGSPPPTHTEVMDSGDVTGRHAPGRDDPGTNCSPCHQADLMGRYRVPACYSCHGQFWAEGEPPPPSHVDLMTVGSISGLHAAGRENPQDNCVRCHGSDLFGSSLIPACWSCHGSFWDPPPDYPPTHTKRQGGGQHGGYHHDPRLNSPIGVCDACHGAELAGTPLIPSCYSCHGRHWPPDGNDGDGHHDDDDDDHDDDDDDHDDDDHDG